MLESSNNWWKKKLINQSNIYQKNNTLTKWQKKNEWIKY